MHTLNFSQLSLQDAMDLATLVEEEARDRYEELAEELAAHHTPAAASFFTRMARTEEAHRKQLEDRRRARFGHAPSSVTASMLPDVEAPPLDSAQPWLTVRQALAAALEAERRSHAFFSHALTQVSDPQVRALFSQLLDEELEHQRLVHLELKRLDDDASSHSNRPAP